MSTRVNRYMADYKIGGNMDEEKVQAYADLAAQMMELHASVALLAQNVEKMARTDEEVTSMTRIFNGVFKNAAQQTNYREPSPPA